jgi:hypothetical protein
VGSNLGTVAARRPDPHLTRHIDGLHPTLEQLVDAAEAVSTLVEHRGWNVLCALLDSEIATISGELENRREPLASRADYAHRHGRMGGLKAPQHMALALIDRAESRLEEQRRKHEDAGESASERTG